MSAMRAFESAARHLSFTRAAAELCVTQAAVSHQVRQLEQWLGRSLFLRRGHTLALTHKGRAYLDELSLAFDRMAAATEQVRERKDGPLRITALPSFASRWLLPRLPTFRARHPDIEIKFSSSVQLWSGDDEFDLGIRSGLGRWPGLKADLIAREYLSPVCSPTLRQEQSVLAQPAGLTSVMLLHDEPRAAWRHWGELTGVSLDLDRGVQFSDAALVLQAAADGLGVALGRLMLAADDLRAGRLVQLFDLALPNDFSYWLVYAHATAQRPEAAAFRAWLLEAAHEHTGKTARQARAGTTLN